MSAGATIKRGKRPAAKRTARGKKPPSMLTRAIGAIPISAAMWQQMATWTILATAGGAVIAIAVMLGIPGYVGQQMAEGVGRAGFAVKRVEVTGIDRMERLTVYAVALDQNSRAMPLVDLNKVRACKRSTASLLNFKPIWQLFFHANYSHCSVGQRQRRAMGHIAQDSFSGRAQLSRSTSDLVSPAG